MEAQLDANRIKDKDAGVDYIYNELNTQGKDINSSQFQLCNHTEI